ncbi:hypothetical protein HPB48_021989 [Haemaphysalis longicornis]|uniref:FMN-dependent dehydrogenase domain-containing protein n=1 Tax=Haemaphysalis longicornis TaxID=44386 RepID=A0A9J6GA34_HAELO|nr:hypothetical protein HPB48_021989 [Haemaphysalis longicornis]
MDGGIRSGPDVVKALCLGTQGVFMGRPILYGLAYKFGRRLRRASLGSPKGKQRPLVDGPPATRKLPPIFTLDPE